MHAARDGQGIQSFRRKDFDATSDVLEYASYRDGELPRQVELRKVKGFFELRTFHDELKLHTRWRGVEDDETTWDPVANFKQDVPVRLQDSDSHAYISYTLHIFSIYLSNFYVFIKTE